MKRLLFLAAVIVTLAHTGARQRGAAMKALMLALLGLAVVGCRTEPLRTTTERARFQLETTAGEGEVVTLPQSGTRIRVQTKPVFTEYDIVNVDLAQVELGYCLMFQLTPAAARDLYQLTVNNPGRRLVLMLGGVAFGSRRIGSPLDQGMVFIFVETPDAALRSLVASLKETCANLHPGAPKP